MNPRKFPKEVPFPQMQVLGLGDNTTRVISINERVKKLAIEGIAVLAAADGTQKQQPLVAVRQRDAFDTAMEAIASAKSFDDGIDSILKEELATQLNVDPASL